MFCYQMRLGLSTMSFPMSVLLFSLSDYDPHPQYKSDVWLGYHLEMSHQVSHVFFDANRGRLSFCCFSKPHDRAFLKHIHSSPWIYDPTKLLQFLSQFKAMWRPLSNSRSMSRAASCDLGIDFQLLLQPLQESGYAAATALSQRAIVCHTLYNTPLPHFSYTLPHSPKGRDTRPHSRIERLHNIWDSSWTLMSGSNLSNPRLRTSQ